jgi:A/G-specific adenine glycosylase
VTFGDVLLAWAAENGRHLPWRATRDGWAVLVSEMMLQQTQVARVRDSYVAFLTAFPTPASCAQAPVAEVIRAWSGLGYNRRAVQLHRCAQRVVDDHQGCVPDTLEDLLALPGIGPYTARAVLAFAHGHDVGVVDTNAARVLARAIAGRPLRPREAQRLADDLVPARCGWSWNQAMLDLGAIHCRARPQCGTCPVADHCRWQLHAGNVDPAVGSFATSRRQSRFEGSDRQGRGRLVAALRIGAVARAELAGVMGWPEDPARAARVAATVVADRLAHDDGIQLALRN